MSTKAALREQLRAARRALPPAARRAASEAVQRHVAALVGELGVRHVACYAAHGSELDVSSIELPGVVLSWPRVHPGDASRPAHIVFCEATRAMLRPGYRGLYEPPADSPVANVVELVLVPALGFDRLGRRLGQGGGFYDRAITALRGEAHPPLVLGLAFDLQLVDVLPDEPHDARMDGVITEAGLVVDRWTPEPPDAKRRGP